MTGVIYLAYKSNYALQDDRQFLDWMQWIGRQVPIARLVVVDNFNTGRENASLTMNGVDVKVVGGNNAEREFSGYMAGLREMADCRNYILLNDTFLQKKHAPYALLGPAIRAVLEKTGNTPLLFGEINKAPVRATFGNLAAINWISSYCFVFGHEVRSPFVGALELVNKDFSSSNEHLGGHFIAHINRQMRERPEAESASWMESKYCATASEIRLSQFLRTAGVKLRCMYSVDVSTMLFLRNTLRRVARKLKFKLGIM